MLTLSGDICITNSLEDLGKCRFTHKIILIGEPDKDLMVEFNAISGSLFMPPYEAVMEEMDGNIDGFRNLYYHHLYSNECQEYIALIFRALYEGKKILLYLSKDESELMYSRVLIEYFASVFGLMISVSPERPANFNQQFANIVCDLLYLYDLFSINEYFMNRIESPIATMILQKLISEMNPYVENRTLEQYQLYFSKYQRAVQSVPFPITNGLVFEE